MDSSQFSGSTKQIAACIVASLPVFMAGIVLGWPSPVMDYMSTGRAPVSLTAGEMSLMVALIDVGNFLMAVPAGQLMDRMGRKFAVNVSAPLMLTGWLFALYGHRTWCLYVARLLQGAAVGIGWVVAPAYVGEMASVQIRGLLGLLIQLSYAAGLLFSYTAGWLLEDYTSLTVVSAFVAVVSGALFALLPESPYYLMLDGRADDAAKCLWSLRSYTDEELQTELMSVKKSVINDRRLGNIGDLLNRDRRPLVIVLVLAVLQMACGASVLEAYAATILSGTSMSANASAVVLGLIIFVAAVPFALAVDRCGRRPLMVFSCFGTAACHAIAAVCFVRWPAGGGGTPVFVAVAGAQFCINVGIMPLLSVVQCEYFPSDTRALADTAVVLTVTLASTVMILAYPAVVAAYGVAANFALYTALSLAGGAFCCAFMPETKCKSFVEIQMDFHGTDRSRHENAQKQDYQQI